VDAIEVKQGVFVGYAQHATTAKIWQYNNYLWIIFPSNPKFAYAWGPIGRGGV